MEFIHSVFMNETYFEQLRAMYQVDVPSDSQRKSTMLTLNIMTFNKTNITTIQLDPLKTKDLENLTLVIGTVIVCIGILSNTLVLTSSFACSPQKKCLMKTMHFIRSLAVTDLLSMLLMVGYMLHILIAG